MIGAMVVVVGLLLADTNGVRDSIYMHAICPSDHEQFAKWYESHKDEAPTRCVTEKGQMRVYGAGPFTD